MFYKLKFILSDNTNMQCIVNEKNFLYIKKVLWKKSDVSIFKSYSESHIKNFFKFFFKFFVRYKFKSNLRFLCEFFILFPKGKVSKNNNYLFDYKDINNLENLEKVCEQKEMLININNVLIFSYELINN